jgi:hypothetical protein
VTVLHSYASWVNTFCAATRLQAGDLRTCGSISGGSRRFVFFVKAFRLVVGPTQPPIIVGARSASAGSKVARA